MRLLKKQGNQSFAYDTILERQDICNLLREKKALQEAILQKKKLVVYGPRNSGKTSLIQSVIIPEFRKKHKNCFILNIELMEIKSEEALSQRIKRGFEISFSENFPSKNIWNMAVKFLSSLKPTLEVDPITAQTSISLSSKSANTKAYWQDILQTIKKEIVPKMPTLIIMDEFQDIVFVDGAQGMMRQALQEFNNVPIILLGSKNHLLSKIFANPSAPLAQFGEDLRFDPIPYEEYTAYINTRFREKRLKISLETSKQLQDALQRVPEAVNVICAALLANFEGKTVTWHDISRAMIKVIDNRKERYERYLSFFSEKEVSVLNAIQKFGPIKQPNSKEFLNRLTITGRTVRKIFNYLYDHSIIDKETDGFRIADPLLGLYLSRYK